MALFGEILLSTCGPTKKKASLDSRNFASPCWMAKAAVVLAAKLGAVSELASATD